MTWPPRWDGPQFKGDQPNRVRERRLKKMAVDLAEKQNKALVRKRDKRCRFPLCECQKWRRRAEVSHREHKGPGGDPKGIRSGTENMILLCVCRHRENRVSIHQGNLRWDPNTNAGANGSIRWYELHGKAWILLATEKAIGQWDITASQ